MIVELWRLQSGVARADPRRRHCTNQALTVLVSFGLGFEVDIISPQENPCHRYGKLHCSSFQIPEQTFDLRLCNSFVDVRIALV